MASAVCFLTVYSAKRSGSTNFIFCALCFMTIPNMFEMGVSLSDVEVVLRGLIKLDDEDDFFLLFFLSYSTLWRRLV